MTPKKIQATVRKIVRLEQPRKIILFGSTVTGRMHRDSDLDVLVVTGRTVHSPRRESVRLRRALRGISMPMDILVISEKRLEQLREQPGLIYGEAVRHGKVIYENTAA